MQGEFLQLDTRNDMTSKLKMMHEVQGPILHSDTKRIHRKKYRVASFFGKSFEQEIAKIN